MTRRVRSQYVQVLYAPEAYMFIFLLYFCFCFSMSKYSEHIERDLAKGRNF